MSRGRRWLRRGVLGLLLAAAVGVGAAAFVTRGPVPGWIVARLVRDGTGCDFSARSAAVQSNGTVIIDDLRLRLPGVAGEGGEALRAERVVIDLDWSGWMSLDIRPRGVEVLRPIVRISQSIDGRINLAAAGPTGSAVGGSVHRLPHVRVLEGSIELGEHNGTTYAALARLPIEGSVTPIGDGGPGYAVQLSEIVSSQAPPDSGVHIEGTLEPAKGAARARLSGLALDKWTPETVPGAFREAWRQLALDGRVAGAEVRYTREAGLEGEVMIEGISMSLPVPDDREDKTRAQRVRMHEVSGSLKIGQGGLAGAAPGFEATLNGKIEDLPCRISLRTVGLDPDNATIDCEVLSEGFEMRKTGALRAFAPELVLQRLAQFSGPTALVDARVKVRRDQGAWSYNGTVLLREGRAAFEHFPYPFFDIAGRVEFDDEKVRIVGLTGKGLTGASMVATGEIWPPDDGTNVMIRVDVTNAPTDEVLAAAVDRRTKLAEAVLWKSDLDAFRTSGRSMARPGKSVFGALLGEEAYQSMLGGEQSWRMGLYHALFSRDDYVAMVEEGLLLNPELKQGLSDELAALRRTLAQAGDGHGPADARALDAARARADDLDRRLAAPEFAFGGMIDRLVVNVKRGAETGGHYDTDIDIKFRSAGLVPEPFPLPVLADNLAVRVREDRLEFEGKDFRALRGGSASVKGVIDTTDPERTAKVPRMHIDARRLAVDDLLIRAIPERMGRTPDDHEPLQTASAPDMLRALNVAGTVDCLADIRQLDAGRPGFDVTITLDGLTARPRRASPGESALALGDLRGVVHVTENGLEIPSLAGSVSLADHADDPAAAPGALKLAARTDFASAGAGASTLRATVDADGVDLAWPLEDLVAAISADAAAKLTRLREDHRPSGRVDARVIVSPNQRSQRADAGLRVAVDMQRASELAFDVLGGRLVIDHRSGSVGIISEQSDERTLTDVRFDQAVGSLSFDGVQSGDLTLSGPVGVDATGKLVPRGRLQVNAAGGSLESNLTRRILGAALSPRVQEWMTRSELGGRFDADLVLSPKSGPEGQEEGWSAGGTIFPHTLQITRESIRTSAGSVTGRLELDGRRVGIRELAATTGDWSMKADGAFVSGEEGPDSWRLELDLSGRAATLEPTLLSLVPEGVNEAVKSADIRIADGFELASAQLRLAGRTTDAEIISRAAFRGELAFSGMSADVGIALTEGTGKLVVDSRLPEGRAWADVRLDLTLPALRAAGIGLTEASAVIATSQRQGEVVAPMIGGRCAGGLLSGTAFLHRREDAPGREFGARIELGGVRLGDLIADLEKNRPGGAALISLGAMGPIDGGAAQASGSSEPTPRPPVERGLLTGNISLAGVSGDPSSRRGRGSLVISGGDVVGVPLMAPMLELSNMIPPVGDKLNYLESQFYLQGPLITFERVQLQSGTVEVVGDGTMRMPGMELDLKFNSRGRARVPIWSDLLERLRDEMITTTVRGTLREPVFGSESLSGTRKMLSGIFGPEPSPDLKPAPLTPEQVRAPGE